MFRQVLECGSPLPLSPARRIRKAAEDCRTPRRWRAGGSSFPVHGTDARPMLEVEASHKIAAPEISNRWNE